MYACNMNDTRQTLVQLIGKYIFNKGADSDSTQNVCLESVWTTTKPNFSSVLVKASDWQ